MSKIRIEMFPAIDGDCLLVNYGNKLDLHILIDGGRKETYNSFLKKRLKEINSKGEIINLLIVTHIDSDHIEGIIELLKDNESSDTSTIIKINEIWHNGLCHIPIHKKTPNKISQMEEDILEEIIAANSKNSSDKKNDDSEISYKQGNTLFDLICMGEYKWNKSFGKKAINFDLQKEVTFGDLKIKILSPNSKMLEKISRKWLNTLNKYKYGFYLNDEKIFDNAFELFMKNDHPIYSNENEEISHSDYSKIEFLDMLNFNHENDKSVTNGASISFIIEYGTKKMLFLGDSHCDIVKESIKELIKNENYKPFFDIIKLSHHGSIKNISKDFLKIIDGYKYLISTNGTKHGHPDLPVLAWIVSRDKRIHRKLLFNYNNTASKYYNTSKLKKTYNYSVIVPESIKPTIIDL
ncbi:MAG: hypothetical protein ABF289_17495 [Clostridiales bacterium]